jgi:peptide/nickel transport system substrate-binding protein
VLKFVGKAGLTELLSGNVDLILDGELAQIPFVAKDPRFHAYHTLYGGARAIYWKCDHPLFHDVRVRRALTLAIDRRELLGVINLPSDLSITDGIFTMGQFRRRQLPEPLPYDPVQARALLEAAGWQDRDGDGVREREGRPFRFAALVRGLQGYDRLAVYVQAQFRRVGVQMEVQVLDPAAVGARRAAGDFEAVFNLHQPVPDYQPQHFGRDNPNGYRNPDVVRLIDQAMATADPDELDRIYQALTEIFRADLPFTRLVPNTVTAFAHRRVRGPSTTYHGADDMMEDLWLEKER